jgi:hypothetical protein
MARSERVERHPSVPRRRPTSFGSVVRRVGARAVAGDRRLLCRPTSDRDLPIVIGPTVISVLSELLATEIVCWLCYKEPAAFVADDHSFL